MPTEPRPRARTCNFLHCFSLFILQQQRQTNIFKFAFFASLVQAFHFSGGGGISVEQEQLRNLCTYLENLNLGKRMEFLM